MPLYKNKIHHLSPSPKDLKDGEEVFVIPETKECFRTYDEYIAKVFIYSSQDWSCEYTGKSDLTYKNAVASEKEALKELAHFPECFKGPLLKTIHKDEGGLKEVLVKCTKFLKSHFWLGEEVIITKSKNRRNCSGVIVEASPSNTEKERNADDNADKENGGSNLATTQFPSWRYSVQLAAEGDIVLRGLSAHEIKRKRKLPRQDQIRIFIKYNAERVPVGLKKLWIIKEDLAEKYNLAPVPKSNLETGSKLCTTISKELRNPLRSPFETISQQNGNTIAKPKTKKISPKFAKDRSQRTLNFFMQSPNSDVPSKVGTTPTKQKSSEISKGSPVVAELQITLTPTSKLKEALLERSAEKFEDNSVKSGDKLEASRTLFSSGQETTKVADKVDEAAEGPQITIQDDEDDFVAKKHVKNVAKKREKHKNDSKKNTGEKLTEKNKATHSKDKPNLFSNTLTGVKTNRQAKHDVILVDDDFSQKEKSIVKKNALKKQKTLSQMFQFNTCKSSAKIQDKREVKTNDIFELPSREQQVKDKVVVAMNNKRMEHNVKKGISQNELGKPLELQPLVTGLEFVPRSLPSPKPVSVPEELRRCYADVLMMTEFIHFYGSFLCSDRDLKCSPDDLVSELLTDGHTKSDIFARILIGFLNVLLKDLRKKSWSKKFSDFGVNLVDMVICESTVGDITRLYLQHSHDRENSLKKGKQIMTAKKLADDILTELHEKDVFNLNAVQKLKVLTHLLDQVLLSEVFYSHYGELEESRRLAWHKKIELDTKIREIVQEQKKLKEEKNPQKEIQIFLEKSNGDNEEMTFEKGATGDCGQGSSGLEDIANKAPKDNPERTENGVKDGNASSSNLTKRQEMAEKSKMEKEKLDEMRRLSEEHYQKKQAGERLKEKINGVRECRRVESLGSDRNHSRYWLLHSHPEALFVEKIACYDGKTLECDDIEDPANEKLEDRDMDMLSSERSWFCYDTEEGIDRLISSLDVLHEQEYALKTKLKTLKKHEGKNLLLRKRQINASISSSEEASTDPLASLKEEMCDLATRMTEADVGSIENLQAWIDRVMSESSHAGLATSAVTFASAVKIKSLWKKLDDREEWLERWVQAVKCSKTLSRSRFCIAMLDCCIMWDTSSLFKKCKVCRRTAGAMAICEKCRQGYHLTCLRPAMDELPDEWLCRSCKPVVEKKKGGKTTKKKRVVISEDSEEENDDCCDVCGGDGELVCCDNCPNSYHKECHDPPLRNVPRGFWKCCSCQGRRPTANVKVRKFNYYEDLESSEEESGEDSAFSEDDMSSEETGSESEVEEDQASVERAERARKRELRREEKETGARKKKESNKRKGKGRASKEDVDGEDKENVPQNKVRVSNRECLNEDSSDSEDSSPREKRRRLRECVTNNVEISKEENAKRSSKKRKCTSLQDESSSAKRKRRQNPELKMCEELLKDLMHHEDSWAFVEPVDMSEVPDYLEIVSCPMDLGTMKRKLNAFEYHSYKEFLNDIKLMFANSSQYNLNTSDHGLAGISLEAYFKEILPNYFPEYEMEEPGRKPSKVKSRKRKS